MVVAGLRREGRQGGGGVPGAIAAGPVYCTRSSVKNGWEVQGNALTVQMHCWCVLFGRPRTCVVSIYHSHHQERRKTYPNCDFYVAGDVMGQDSVVDAHQRAPRIQESVAYSLQEESDIHGADHSLELFSLGEMEHDLLCFRGQAVEGRGVEGAYSRFACLSHRTIDPVKRVGGGGGGLSRV